MARSRTKIGIFAPFLLVLVAAGTWSVAWYYIAQEAGVRIAEAIDEASGRGITLDCGDQEIGGYPFRIEFRCADPQLVIENASGQTTLRSQLLVGVALAYNLDQIIVELYGPTRIDTFELGGARQNFTIATNKARASFDFTGTQVSAASIVAENVEVAIPNLGLGNFAETSVVSADRAVFHLRQADQTAVDVAFTIDKYRLAGELALTWFEAPELVAGQVDFLGQLTDVDLGPVGSFADALFTWQGRGGELKIQSFKVDAPALDFEISGIARLDASGEVQGDFTGIFGKLDRLIDELKLRGVLNDDSAKLAAGAVGLLARPVEGSAKVQLPVNVTDGEVFIGPIKTLILPPLF